MNKSIPTEACGRDSPLRWDQICDHFERSWRQGDRPDLGEHLSEGGSQDLAEHFADLLTIELAYRRRLGERPSLLEYEGRFPDLADCLASYFSAVRTVRPAVDLEPGSAGTSAAVAGTSALEDATEPGVADERPESYGSALPDVAGYEILGVLGRGGMGVVYLARHTRLGRLCALKMISAGELADPDVSARFLAEAQTVARLRHPSIVQIYHIGDHAGRPFVELEYVDGGSLASRLDGTPWPAAQAAHLDETLAVAMHEAHRLGIVHRDLKPGNVLMTSEGEPKITDFGLAKLLEGSSDLTQTELIMGTPSYMAPEQAWGHAKQVGPSADVYALGAILYELLTGRPPFKGANALETVEQVKSIEPVPPSRLQPGLPRDLETICLTCLQKEPGRRYQTAGALAEDLRRYQRGEPIRARRSGRAEQAWKWCRRNPTKALLTAVFGVLLLSLTLGPAVTSLVWLRERDKARLAEQAAAEQLRETYVSQARSLRRSRQPGRRFQALSILAKAARIRPGPDLRDEAIACMALVDLRVARQWPIRIPSFSRPAADRKFERYALSDDQGNLAVRSLEDDRLLLSLPGFGKRCQTMQFSPNGKFLAASYDDYEFYFWDLAQGEALPWIYGEVTVWAFSPGGRDIAVGRGDRSIVLYSLSDGHTQGRFHLDEEAVSLDLSPDGSSLAVACGHVVKILDVATGRDLATLSHGVETRCVRWGARGRLLATVSFEDRIRVWEVNGWKPVWSEEPHAVARKTTALRAPAQQLAFSPDGDLLVCDGLEGIRVFDVWSGRVLVTLPGLLSGAGLGGVQLGWKESSRHDR